VHLSVLEKSDVWEMAQRCVVWRAWDGSGGLPSKWEVLLNSSARGTVGLKIKRPKSVSAMEPDRGGARPQIIVKFSKNIKHASFFLLCQDFFLTYLHLMCTALEILQHKTQDTFRPMAVKCSLTNLYLILIHRCHA